MNYIIVKTKKNGAQKTQVSESEGKTIRKIYRLKESVEDGVADKEAYRLAHIINIEQDSIEDIKAKLAAVDQLGCEDQLSVLEPLIGEVDNSISTLWEKMDAIVDLSSPEYQEYLGRYEFLVGLKDSLDDRIGALRDEWNEISADRRREEIAQSYKDTF